MKKILLGLCIYLLTFSLVAESADEMIEKIKSFDQVINEYQLNQKQEKQTMEAKLFQEKKEKLKEIEQYIQGRRESDSKFSERKENDRLKIENSYKKLLETESEKIDINYNAKIKNAQDEKETLIKKVRNTTFEVDENDIKVSIGNFDANATPQYWPVTIQSLKSALNFDYKDKIEIEETEGDDLFFMIDDNKSTAIGNIKYKIEIDDAGTSFRKKINEIQVFIIDNNARKKIKAFVNLDLYENGKGFSEDTKKKETAASKTDNKNVKQNIDKDEKIEKVWVPGWDNTSTAHYVFEVLSYVSGGMLFVGGTTLLIVGLAEGNDSATIWGGSLMGAGTLITLAVGLPLSLTHDYHSGHYEERKVSRIESNPLLQHVAIAPGAIIFNFTF